MLRRLFMALSALSLLLCLGLAALWVRSYRVHDSVVLRKVGGRPDSVHSLGGRLVYVFDDAAPPRLRAGNYYADSDTEAYRLYNSPWRRAGFGTASWMGQTIVSVPHAALVCLSLLMPLLGMIRRHRLARRGFPPRPLARPDQSG